MDFEREEFDIQRGLVLSQVWSAIFSIMHVLVLLISIILYLSVVRAIANNNRKENPTYFLILFLFFTSLVDHAIVIEEFMAIFGHFVFSTANCQFITFTVYGNKILQACTMLVLLYYNWAATELKTTKFVVEVKKYFPVVILVLFLAEVLLALEPALNVEAGQSGQFCVFVNQEWNVQRRHGWLYNSLLPYLIPLIVVIFPVIKLSLKLKESHIIEPRKSYVLISLAVTGGYFLFYFLYYMLMTAREIESMMLERSEWNKLLGMTLWYMTRPMFTLVGHGWHIVVPLSCFILDKDLKKEWPGPLLHKKTEEEVEDHNSIVMEDREHKEDEELDNDGFAQTIETREFNQSWPEFSHNRCTPDSNQT